MEDYDYEIYTDSEYSNSSNDNDEEPENIKIKFKRFNEGLKQYDLTVDILNETGWHYYGGTIHVATISKKATKKHYNKLMMINPLMKINPTAFLRNIIKTSKNYTYKGSNGVEQIDMTEFRNCVCNEEIKNFCFIANSDRTEYFIIGNCCIKNFIKANSITCEECGNEHRNKIKNLCNDCKIIQKCEICSAEHSNLNHNMCNKCYNQKECKDCKLKYSKIDYNEETERCKDCQNKYCAKCNKKKNPKYIKRKLCYDCKFPKYADVIIAVKKDNTTYNITNIIKKETIKKETVISKEDKKCLDCVKMIKYNFERCWPCKMKYDKIIGNINESEQQTETDTDEEIIKKCLDCTKIIKANFTRCFHCNDKHKNK